MFKRALTFIITALIVLSIFSCVTENDNKVFIKSMDDDIIGNNFICEEYVLDELYFLENQLIKFPLRVVLIEPHKGYKYDFDPDRLEKYINKPFLEHDIAFKVTRVDTVVAPVQDNIANIKSFLRAYNKEGYMNLLVFPSKTIFFSELEGTKRIKIIHGAALQIPSTALFIREEVLNTHITSHELGHALGLYHIFQQPDLSNMGFSCASGDYVNDTPAAFIDRNGSICTYFPNDTTISDVKRKFIIKNIMSYSYPICLEEFSKGQGERMRKQIELTKDLRDIIIRDEVNINYNNYLFSDI